MDVETLEMLKKLPKIVTISGFDSTERSDLAIRPVIMVLASAIDRSEHGDSSTYFCAKEGPFVSQCFSVSNQRIPELLKYYGFRSTEQLIGKSIVAWRDPVMSFIRAVSPVD